jgi:phenylacetate-coenzyme A ligase PaaK-like adenylate-forming protein
MATYLERLRWPRSEIVTEQTRALRNLLAHATAGSSWHRRRLGHLDLERFTPADLALIPPMTKDDLMEHWDVIVTDRRCTLERANAYLKVLTRDAYFLDRYHVVASGGSSGKRGVFIYDWHGWAASYVSPTRSLVAALRSVDPAPAGPIASVSADVATHMSSGLTQTFTRPDLPVVRAPATLPIDRIVEILNRAQPALLHSYPSMLPALCEEARSGRLRISPAFVWTTSEPLLPEIRNVTEGTWKVPVLNAWAASETTGTFPCAYGTGFHLSEDLSIIEPVDAGGAAVPPGVRSDRILITNLCNRLMPLIRYEISDEFELTERPCLCGSSFLKAQDVHGRHEDSFEYAGGVRIHPLRFDTVLGREPWVLEYRVSQTVRGAQVDVVTSGAGNLESLRWSLEAGLAEGGLDAPHVVVRRVETLRNGESGKLRRFIPLAGTTPAGPPS